MVWLSQTTVDINKFIFFKKWGEKKEMMKMKNVGEENVGKGEIVEITVQTPLGKKNIYRHRRLEGKTATTFFLDLSR